jgi:TonB family protein
MLLTIALSVQLLAPAIAFSPKDAEAKSTVASPNCTRDVTIVAPAVPPQGLHKGKALIDVSVSAAGTVTGTRVAQSSGSPDFDRAATKAAKASTYAPAMKSCKPVAGLYRFILSSEGE